MMMFRLKGLNEFSNEDNKAIIDAINAANPDLLRYRCSDVHTRKQDQQFLLLRSVAVCDRLQTDLSGNECESVYYGTGTF